MKIIKFAILLFFILFSFSANDSYCAEEILSKNILVDGKNFSLDEKGDTIYQKFSKEINEIFKNREHESLLAKNMLFITSAEIALTSSINTDKPIELPIRINENAILIGFLKYDTIDGFGCRTIMRITNAFQVYSTDIFTYTSDYDKMLEFINGSVLEHFQKPNLFIETYTTYMKNRKNSPSSKTFPILAKSQFYNLQGYLWFLKTSFISQEKPKIILETSEFVKKALQLD